MPSSAPPKTLANTISLIVMDLMMLVLRDSLRSRYVQDDLADEGRRDARIMPTTSPTATPRTPATGARAAAQAEPVPGQARLDAEGQAAPESSLARSWIGRARGNSWSVRNRSADPFVGRQRKRAHRARWTPVPAGILVFPYSIPIAPGG